MSLLLSDMDLDRLYPARLETWPDGRIIAIGPSLKKFLGSDTIGAPLLDVFAVERPKRIRGFDDLLARGVPVILRLRADDRVHLQGTARVDGGVVHLLLGHTLNLSAAPGASVLTHRDFSPADCSSDAFLAAAVHAQFAQDARRIAHELERARRCAEAANSAKSAFMANVTHELRTPLNAVIGYSELMRDAAADEGRDDDVQDHEQVLGAARGLLSLINDVLDYSRLGAQRLDLDVEPFDIRLMMTALCEEMRPLAAANGNTISFACADDVPVCHGDAAVIERCLRQLVSNAVKFTVRGEVKLHAGIEGDVLVVNVEDTGAGIAEEALGDLFTAFRKPHSEGGGAGLGLALTQRLAESLAGEVIASSTLGAGSTFTLRLPGLFAATANAAA
ncbi:sensor histidine kinase [Vitreimonas flagellata]|uniref:sensor histidine kinase n=1 Tax=Vitreimonas flagellata TaxID=2560861 RepID=UPI001074F6FA|nr:HAMP domain-containing sensor histidine kinase [Vitreimonas flagellata]